MAHCAFSGSYDHSLDGKGRVIIPVAFREELGENFTITVNPTRTAIAVYPQDVWAGELEKLSHINPMDKRGAQYVRYRMSVSFTGNNIDAQGRVLVPQKLRAKMGLARDIVFVGMGDYIEIWDADAYAQFDEQAEENFDELVDYVYETYPGRE